MTQITQPFSRWWLVFGTITLLATIAWMSSDLLITKSGDAQPTSSPISRPTATDILITKGEELIATKPPTVAPYVALSSYYIQKVRETADAAYYIKVEELMKQAAKIDPNDASIFATRSSVAAGRHMFKEALAQAEQAINLDPDKTAYLGLKADAQIELGLYEEAATTLQAMVNRRPDPNVFSRIAYLREIHGDIDGAITALEEASSGASSFPENNAWTLVELGKLHMQRDTNVAKTYFDQALAIAPNYPPALKWNGMLAAWSGDYDTARQNITQALLFLPIAEYATDLGDLYVMTGDTKKAAQQYVLSRIAYNRTLTNGTNTDLELAFFLADHNLDPDIAVEKAQTAYHDRQTIFSADTLSWAWYVKKDFAQAQQYSKEALRLGEHDAKILFHAGMIAYQLQDKPEAKRLLTKALQLNPFFSLLQERVAKETLQQL